jgi:hypothetical protein
MPTCRVNAHPLNGPQSHAVAIGNDRFTSIVLKNPLG